MAITGKPLAATAGASIFQQGGNAIDVALCHDSRNAYHMGRLELVWETQALIYNPHTGKVIGINALGVSNWRHSRFFPEYEWIIPNTGHWLRSHLKPGGICTMLAEYGTMSLKQVLAPAMTLASGYPIENKPQMVLSKKKGSKDWKYSKEIFLTHQGEEQEAPYPGEIFKQLDLLATLQKWWIEANALQDRNQKKEAIYVAYDRFYKGDIVGWIVRGVKEEADWSKEDLANWKVYIEEPVSTNYKGIDMQLTHYGYKAR